MWLDEEEENEEGKGRGTTRKKERRRCKCEGNRGRGAVGFFFQAEDGIRDYDVTGVQTCALPILRVDDPPPDLLCISSALRRCSITFGCAITSSGAKIGRASCRERV